ncbi:cell wall-binding repeat-containing protein [Fictibacillus nanhaiensis]|uniref:cell wall-binding repeat-containing protein n=1 Tax=Fictibacillus nanhaiensis TaxID=742169 RepID=UPI001C93B112|nr:cell wall-binding repeat-containing protein [Fictibacillus nanhaiensis]MBY6037109.1 cell wall-binding repeat-containing protein [Fictibacillus nanhaiensis]
MKKKLSILLFLFVLVLSNAAVSANEATVERVNGQDRFEVAVNVSKKGWSSGSTTVVLVNYKAFADALAASPLGYKLNAPILLTNPDRLNAKTEEEIKRLKASKVIIIGGTSSINQNVETKLSGMNLSIERIGGKDRYEVAYKVSRKLSAAGKVVISNGTAFADALSISPYASKHEYPILLTTKDKLPAYTQKALQEKKPQQTIIVGGTGSVYSTVEKQLVNPLRIGGKDRFEVAVNIAKKFNPSSTKAAISNGNTFADALTGSVLSAKQNMPLLLTQVNAIPSVTKNYIDQSKFTSFTVFGGTGSVSNAVVSQLKNDLPLAGKRIVLDAGHGGTDPGAVNGKFYEKNLNMSFTKLLAGHLKGMGAEIIYTRDPANDKFISLEDRAAFANTKNADLFISIHHDSSVDKSASGQSIHYSSYRPGIETKDVYVKYAGKTYPFVREDTERKLFYYKDGSTTKSMSYQGDIIAYDTISPSSAAKESAELAPIASTAIRYNGIGAGYIKDHNLFVTRWTTMPSILIELGYMSNNSELSILSNSSAQNSRSHSLAKAIENFYR